MKADLVLAERRLEWAKHRIYQFNAEVDLYIEAGHIGVSKQVKYSSAGFTRVEWYFHAEPEIRATIRFCAGDAIHNLRAVVDSLVRAVGDRHQVPRLALEFKNGTTHFQKFTDGRHWTRLPAAFRSWYESQQVFSQHDRKPSLLHSLTRHWNEDKHAAPVLLASTTPMTTISENCRGHASTVCILKGGIVPDGTLLMTADVSTPDVPYWNPDFALDVAFGEGDEYESARDFLRRVQEHISKDVFPCLAAFI